MTVGLPIRDEQGEIDSALFLHTSVEEATSGLTAAWQGLLLSLVIALIIVVLLAILLSRHFIDPLKRLQRTTAKLADGDYRARTNLDMQDEIGQLGDEIDMLAERLEEAESERHFTDASRRKFCRRFHTNSVRRLRLFAGHSKRCVTESSRKTM